jgi:hypothetical protein
MSGGAHLVMSKYDNSENGCNLEIPYLDIRDVFPIVWFN